MIERIEGFITEFISEKSLRCGDLSNKVRILEKTIYDFICNSEEDYNNPHLTQALVHEATKFIHFIKESGL
jgi:hypothetical protein